MVEAMTGHRRFDATAPRCCLEDALNDRTFPSVGWWGCFACASVYVLAGLRSGDVLNLLGSAFFLAAAVSFLIPHYRQSASAEETDL